MKTKELTARAMLIAIIVVMSIIPQLGYISITPALTFTLMHIPVLICVVLFDFKFSVFAGTVFGLSSWFTAITRPTVATDIAFTNPLISVVPRILFAVCAYYIFKSLKNKNIKAALIATGLGGTILHSIFVLTALSLFASELVGGLLPLLMTIIPVFSTVEAVLATIVLLLVYPVLNKAIKR